MSDAEAKPVVTKKPSLFAHAFSYVKFFGSCMTLWGVGYMRFSPTWVAVGTFSYFCLQLARNKRVQLTSSIKEIGENEKKFIVQNFKVGDLPSWVYFPDVERAEWMNRVIKRMWPYISDYARDIILATVAPAVSNQLPSALKPFEFITIDLGDTPPRFGGVKVYMEESIRRDEVVMDLDLMLYSDALIKVKLGKIKAGVKEFELRGTLRVVLKPLLSKVPFFGAATVCFLDSPYISFQLTDMGNLLGLPGVQNTLNSVIHNVVDQMFVLPNRLPIALVDDVNMRQLKYPMPQGVIRIGVIEARRLKMADKNLMGGGSSDPYCRIRVGARLFQTAVKNKTLAPKWNEYFETVVDVKRGQFLKVEVYDRDKGNKDDPLGSTSISLETVYELGRMDTWTKLEEVKTGSVHLTLSWYNLSSQVEDVTTATTQALAHRMELDAVVSSGFLYVVVEQAKNLQRLKQMREPSPYCNLVLGREAQMTEAKVRTQNPAWDSVHHFLVGDPYVDKLQLILRDSKSEALLGRCTIPVKSILKEKDMSKTCHYELEESGSSQATIYVHLEFKALIPAKPKPYSQMDGTFVTDPELLETDDQIELEPDSPPGEETELRQRLTSNDSGESNLEDRAPSPIESMDKNSNGVVREPPSPPGRWSRSPTRVSPLGQLNLTLDYRSASGTLSTTVHSAKNLVGVDKDGLADPYVNVYLVDEHGMPKGEKKKTSHKKDDLNPAFDASFEFAVGYEQLPTLKLRFDVKNHVGIFTRSGRTHYMGSVIIDLCKYVDAVESETDWFDLAPSDTLSIVDRLSLSSG